MINSSQSQIDYSFQLEIPTIFATKQDLFVTKNSFSNSFIHLISIPYFDILK